MVGNYRAFHFSCAGESHLRDGKVCQDNTTSGEKENCQYIVVCDGHGGNDYFRSDVGSKFATKVFVDAVTNSDLIDALGGCKNEKEESDCVAQLVKSIIVHWNELVDSDVVSVPFTDEELSGVSEKAYLRYSNGEGVQSAYGTTLVGAVRTERFWLGLQIGDGRCVVLGDNGEYGQPIPWDEECFLNVTTSICDEKAASEFRYCLSKASPIAIFVASDGIDDCFAGDEKLYDFYRVVLRSFGESDVDTACSELEKYLPELSRIGSGDDMSIAMSINMKCINTAVMKEKIDE